MSTPNRESHIQLLERLDGPRHPTPWRWIGLGGAALVLVIGVIVSVVLSGGKGPTRPTTATTAKAPDLDEPPITGQRAAATADGAGSTSTAGRSGVSGATRSAGTAGTIPDAPPLRTAEGLLLHRGAITAGTPLVTLFKRAGVSTRHALALLKALGPLFSPRRARPGHTWELHVDPTTHAPVYFRYQVGLARIYEVRRVVDSFEARPVKVPVTKRTLRYAGLVGVSLGGELAARGAHPALLARIVGVLTSQPRFFKAQRFGDLFRVLVQEEQVQGHHLGFGPVLALEYQSARSGTLRLYHFRPGTEPAVYYNDRGVSLPTARLHVPVHYTRISSPFGMRFHPVLKIRKLHAGVDLVAPSGTTVRACLPGTVKFAGSRGAYGNLVVLDHGGGLESYYAHLLRFYRGLKKGEKVRARRPIAYVGNTGRSTGAHLHFGLLLRGRWVDPLSYRMRPGQPVPGRYRARLMRIIAERRRLLETTPVLGALRLPARVTTKDEVITGVEEP